MGVQRAYGFLPDPGWCADERPGRARETTTEGLEVARWAGDAWIAGALRKPTWAPAMCWPASMNRVRSAAQRGLTAFPRTAVDPFGRATSPAVAEISPDSPHCARRKPSPPRWTNCWPLCDRDGHDYLLPCRPCSARPIPALRAAAAGSPRPAHPPGLHAQAAGADRPARDPGASRSSACRFRRWVLSAPGTAPSKSPPRVAAGRGAAAFPALHHRARPLAPA